MEGLEEEPPKPETPLAEAFRNLPPGARIQATVAEFASIVEEPKPQATTATLVPVGPASPEDLHNIGIAFGSAPVSVTALEISRAVRKVRLPKKFSTIPKWVDLEKEEVRAILEEEGEQAFEDRRKTTGDKEERPALLKKSYKANGEEVVRLTSEGALRLRVRIGTGRGFVDVNSYNEEVFCKLYEVGRGGYVEIGLSRDGMAAPMFDEWQKDMKNSLEEHKKKLKNTSSLFPEIYKEELKKVDQKLSRLKIWREARLIMEMILGQVSKQCRNPVEISAEAFRVLLWPDRAKSNSWPPNWKQSVEDALTSLNKFTFTLKTYRLESLKGYGSMVAQWLYKELGQGGHGDGVYLIDVTPGFIGCLTVFESGKVSLRSGVEAVTFHWAKDLTKEEKNALGWGVKGEKPVDTFVRIDAGSVFYSSAAGLSDTQKGLFSYLTEKNITLRSSHTSADNKAARTVWNAKDAKEPRLYTSEFCPLIPKGKSYHGALGNFKHNAEAGFYLAGAENIKGRRPGGILHHMGHTIPTGAAKSRRSEIITQALKDLRAVVVDYLGGIVAGHDGNNWVSFEDFPLNDEKALTTKLRLFVFLPENWKETARTKWEETTGRRATDDREEAEREVWEGETSGEPLGNDVVSEADGFRGWPLPQRLRAMMKKRGLRQKDVAALFGVSAPVVTYWLQGEDSKGKRKLIPKRLAPLVVRWVETGEAPTPEELASSRGDKLTLRSPRSPRN
jgi:hypothetical protein